MIPDATDYQRQLDAAKRNGLSSYATSAIQSAIHGRPREASRTPLLGILVPVALFVVIFLWA